MNSKVLIFTNISDERDVTITDGGLPVCFFMWSYISTLYGAKSFNTQYTYTHTLHFIYKYFKCNNIDLVNRVGTGQFLSIKEYDDFKFHCKYKVDRRKDDSDNVLDFVRLTDKAVDKLIHETKYSERHASAQTVKGRLHQLIRYLNYLYRMFHFDNDNNESLVTSKRIKDFRFLVENDVKGLKDNNVIVVDPYESSIPDEIFLKMLDILRPSHAENPFKGSRFRNQLIISVFLETGIRRGALAKIKLSDIRDDIENPRILITRTPNDKSDSRRLQAAQKTRGHSAAISSGLMKQLKTYIQTERIKYPASETHDFLFVSEKGKTAGKPFALNSITDMVAKLSKVIGFHLYPHLFRHKWNEIFDERATTAGYSPSELEDMRIAAMGWSEGTKMNLEYNRFRNAIKVHKLSAERSSGFMPEV